MISMLTKCTHFVSESVCPRVCCQRRAPSNACAPTPATETEPTWRAKIGETARVTALVAATALAFWPAVSRAQAVNNAEIHGVVQDSTGAAVPGAQVKATKIDTGREQTTTSGAAGIYVLPGLPVGEYRLEASAPTFSVSVRSGIVLQVGEDAEVNVTLKPGNVKQVVQVSGAAPMVQTQSTSISAVIDQRRIVDLPLNGRQVTDLIVLSGGAAQPPNAQGRDDTSHDYVNSAVISVNGGQINGNNYLLDGADNNDSHSNINMPFPFPDALQEYSVQTGGISARYGLHPGSVINVVTKSGTNSFHGDVFEFVRNYLLDARNYFSTLDNLHQNQYGGTIGGPIRKNKIFGFGGYQETRISTAPPLNTAFVATPAALNGDFSTLESAACQSNGVAKQLYDPATGQPFPNNYINPNLFSAPAVKLLSYIPTSSDPCGKLKYAIPSPSDEYQDVARMDWELSPRHSVFTRYFLLDYSNPPFYTNNLLTTSRPGLWQRSQSIAVGDQISLTPSFINSLHVSFGRLAVTRANLASFPTPVSLGVNMYNASPNYMELSVSSHFSIGGGSNATATFVRNQWQYADDVDWIHGKHHVIFGAEFLANQMDENNLQYTNGWFQFDGSFTGTPAGISPSSTGDALADLLLGNDISFTDSGKVIIGLREKYVGLYIQDGYQATPKLNLHLGLRWEPNLPEYDDRGRGQHFSLAGFKAGTVTSVYPLAPPGLQYNGDPGIPKAYANGSWLGFAPRFGFAWDPSGSGKESIRGAYGIFFDEPESYTDRDFALAAPWADQITLTAPAGGFANPFQGYPGGDPFPAPPPSKSSTFPLGASYINLPLNLHHMYMQQWGLSLQRQLPGAWVISADYLGNKSTHMRSGTEENPAIYIPGNSSTKNTQARRTLEQLNPTTGAYYSTITLMDDGVNTYYNALRLSAKHRFRGNYTVLASYTYSHCIQDTETLANRLTGNQESDPYNRDHDRGPCDFDIRHNFVASAVYQSPALSNRALNYAAGGWQIGFLMTYNNGFPFSPGTGTDASLSGVGLDRPNAVPGVNPYEKNLKTLKWLNPAAFTRNPPGTFGTTGMNSLLQPHYIDADANMNKLFTVHESQQVQLRFEFFNLFNHTNFDAPVSSFSSASFGEIQSANPARIMQFGAKYIF
jgi:Carboxypeptidase regulatory-like domain